MGNNEYLCETSCNDDYPYKDVKTTGTYCVAKCDPGFFFMDPDNSG